MVSPSLTDRQRRELEFYEEFSERNAPAEVSFDPISGEETRPWNSYWSLIEVVRSQFVSEGQRLLDFGCGKGEFSVIFAKIGYEVAGFDLSPNNVAIAQQLAQKYDLAGRTRFSVGVAERLDYPDESFDVIVGIDILHHVAIPQALSECTRVLKPGGLAVFHEPARVPVFDWLRETRFGMWVAPREVSLDRHITHDERKLSPADFKLIGDAGLKLTAERFLLFSRLDRFVRKPGSKEPSSLEKMDARLFRLLPFLKRFGGIVVLALRKQ